MIFLHFEMLLLDGETSILTLLLAAGSMVLPSNSTWWWSEHVPTSWHTFSEAFDVGVCVSLPLHVHNLLGAVT